VTEEKKLECVLTVKSGEKSMELAIGQDGLDTDEWNKAFKAHFPEYPDGEYEASFNVDGHEYAIGTYECDIEVVSICKDGYEYDNEEALEVSIAILGLHIFSDLLNAIMSIFLQETFDSLDMMDHGIFVIEIG
jgi:hypothetical protein